MISHVKLCDIVDLTIGLGETDATQLQFGESDGTQLQDATS
jgi:hypothetical protein